MTADTSRRVSILGTRVTAASFGDAVGWLERAVAAHRSTFVSPATVYSVMLGLRDHAYRATVNRAGYVLADGMPIVWSLRLLGHRAERVHGDDFFLAFCQRFPSCRHFLLGGAPGQPDTVARELRRRVPAIQIVGSRATLIRPVPPDETAAVIAEIHKTGAEVVWAGMGTPAQDEWMAANSDRVGVPLVGVGSAFDLLAGRTRPAPVWVKHGGLQWLFRLAQEPRRLWRRYLVYNPLFVWYVSLQLLGLRRAGEEADDRPGDVVDR